MSKDSPNALVCVATGYGLPETSVAVSYLRGYGVDAVVLSYHHASVAWHLITALDGMRICVPREQAEAALDLLADVAERNDGADRPYARHAGLNAVVAILTYLIFNVPPPARGIFVVERRFSRALHPAWNPV